MKWFPKLRIGLIGILLVSCNLSEERQSGGEVISPKPILNLSVGTDTSDIKKDTLEFNEADSIRILLRVEKGGNREWRYVQLNNNSHGAILDGIKGIFSWVTRYDDGNPIENNYEFVLAAVHGDSIITRGLVIKVKNIDREPFSFLVAQKSQNGPGKKREDGNYDTAKVVFGIIAIKDPDEEPVEFNSLYTPDEGLFRKVESARIDYLKFHFEKTVIDLLIENKFDMIEFSWATDLWYDKKDSLVFSYGNSKFKDTVSYICTTKLSDGGFPAYSCF